MRARTGTRRECPPTRPPTPAVGHGVSSSSKRLTAEAGAQAVRLERCHRRLLRELRNRMREKCHVSERGEEPSMSDTPAAGGTGDPSWLAGDAQTLRRVFDPMPLPVRALDATSELRVVAMTRPTESGRGAGTSREGCCARPSRSSRAGRSWRCSSSLRAPGCRSCSAPRCSMLKAGATLLLHTAGILEPPGTPLSESGVELLQVAADIAADRALRDEGLLPAPRMWCAANARTTSRHTGHPTDGRPGKQRG